MGMIWGKEGKISLSPENSVSPDLENSLTKKRSSVNSVT